MEQSNAFPLRSELSLELATNLLPLDILSASVLTLALQNYGQNERSLFSFLESNDYLGIHDYDRSNNPYYNLSNVYDYLLHNYYSFISTKYNPHYIQWSAIKRAIERVEAVFETNAKAALKLVKTIGMLNIFAKEGAQIDSEFLVEYARFSLGVGNATEIFHKLQTQKIIRYVNFKRKFILFEGTDLDIDLALLNASHKIDPVENVVSSLGKYFNFPYIPAKAATYKYGTPRFFAFELSESPINKTPTGEVDGFINLIFTENLTKDELLEFSKTVDECIVFAWYRNTKIIREILSEVRKVEYVIDSIVDDRVALKELNDILSHQIEELNHHVLNKLYSNDGDIVWVFNGNEVRVKARSEFNSLLSRICEKVYDRTLVFQNELVNRHKVSSSVTLARKYLFEALVNNWEEEDLGFPKDKFPAEKTIYFTLLRKTGIHRKAEGSFVLDAPREETFSTLWQKSEEFLSRAKIAKKKSG